MAFSFLLFLLVAVIVICLPNQKHGSRYRRRQNRFLSYEDIEKMEEHAHIERAVAQAFGSAAPKTVRYEDEGPSEAFLRFFRYHHPNPQEADLLTIIEMQVSLHCYLEAEQNLRTLVPQTLRDDLRMRCHNVAMQLYSLTGKTEWAVEEFARCQPFAERYLQQNPAGLLRYLDNAATICALTGDFSESERYCAAMEQYVRKYAITDAGALCPQLTEIKRLFLCGETAAAEQKLEEARFAIERFDRYQYPWECRYFLEKLEETRLFAVQSTQDAADNGEMPSLEL